MAIDPGVPMVRLPNDATNPLPTSTVPSFEAATNGGNAYACASQQPANALQNSGVVFFNPAASGKVLRLYYMLIQSSAGGATELIFQNAAADPGAGNAPGNLKIGTANTSVVHILGNNNIALLAPTLWRGSLSVVPEMLSPKNLICTIPAGAGIALVTIANNIVLDWNLAWTELTS